MPMRMGRFFEVLLVHMIVAHVVASTNLEHCLKAGPCEMCLPIEKVRQ